MLPNKKSTERLCSLQDRAWIGIASASGGAGGGQISIAVMRRRFVFHVYMYPAWGGENSYLRRPNVARNKMRYLGSTSRTERRKRPTELLGGGGKDWRLRGGRCLLPRPRHQKQKFFRGGSFQGSRSLAPGREGNGGLRIFSQDLNLISPLVPTWVTCRFPLPQPPFLSSLFLPSLIRVTCRQTKERKELFSTPEIQRRGEYNENPAAVGSKCV